MAMTFDPTMHVRRTGTRTWGPRAWEAWVKTGELTSFRHEHGTYAWSEKGARRRARQLRRSWLRRSRPGPTRVVQQWSR